MSIRLDPTPIKGDLTNAIRKFIPGLVGIAEANYFHGTNALFEAHKAWRTPKSTLGQKAWSLYCDALIRGLHEFIRTTPLPDHRNDEQAQSFISDHLQTCADRCTSDEITLLFSHKQKPTDIELYTLLRDAIPAFIERYAPEHGHEDRPLQIWLDTAFKHGFAQACYADPDAFQALHEALDKSGPADERADIWQKYYDFLSRQIDEDPIFGQPKGGLTLKEVFVELRCFWTKRVNARHGPIQNDNTPQAKRRIHHIHWLNNELRNWALSDDKNDPLRVVTGGPGSGKSSSALILARDLARSGLLNCYLLRLQGLNLSSDIPNIVKEFQEHRDNEPEPLEWLSGEVKPLILIFDGLDEIAPPDTALAQATKDFLNKLLNFLTVRNERSLKVKAIALGRPEATETAAAELRLQSRPLLHILPLCELRNKPSAFDADHDEPSTHREDEYSDQIKLVEIDQRIEFWRKARQVRARYAEPPESMLDPALEDLTQEPLLFYLLLFSGLPADRWKEAGSNRNTLYEDIFTKIHERDWLKKDSVSRDLGSDSNESAANFFTLMECLGLAAWRNGGRTGKNYDFAELRDHYATEDQIETFKAIRASDLDYVAVQFFIRPSEKAQGEFGFVHKSFGEYLTARALLNAGYRWMVENENLTSNVASKWLILTGYQPITAPILTFMKNQVRTLSDSTRDPQAIERAKANTTRYADIISQIIDEGLPADQTDISRSWRQREDLQRNAEESLFALLQCWADQAYPSSSVGQIKLTWPNETASHRLFKRLIKPRELRGQSPVISFSQLDLSHQTLIGADLSFLDFASANLKGADLWGADLGGANLRETNLRGAVLREANLREAVSTRANLEAAVLREANLREAVLEEAVLTRADLEAADLWGTDLRRADLREANLREANLREAVLEAADLREANLREADLWGAVLEGTVLESAVLEGADLRRAKFGHAKCKGASFSNSPLHSANFSKAIDLTQEQINSARGNEHTKLPPGLHHPDHWEND